MLDRAEDAELFGKIGGTVLFGLAILWIVRQCIGHNDDEPPSGGNGGDDDGSLYYFLGEAEDN